MRKMNIAHEQLKSFRSGHLLGQFAESIRELKFFLTQSS